MQRYYKVRKKDRNGGSQLTPPSPTTTSSTTFSNKAKPIVVVALILLNGAYLQWQYTRDAHAATRVYWEEEVAVVKTSSSHDTPSASNKYRNAKHDDETSSASSSALSFVHIPKTAGSAIEKIGKRAQQKWGYFESCFGKSFSECINQSTCRADGNNVANNNSSLPCAPGCAEWHDPELLSAKYKKIDAAATTRSKSSKSTSQPSSVNTGVSCSVTDLANADLTNVILSTADLTNVILSTADLSNAILSGVNLSGADLTGVIWSSTTCQDGRSTDANGGLCFAI